jgi:hypothetical protein
MLFQKHVVRTKLDIYTFITITGPIHLLVHGLLVLKCTIMRPVVIVSELI